MANKQLITHLLEKKLNGDVVGNILTFIDNLVRVDIGKDEFKNPFHIEIKRCFGINRTVLHLDHFYTNCYMCENGYDWKRSNSKKYSYQYCYNCYRKWERNKKKTGVGGGRPPDYFGIQRGVCLIKI